MINIWDDCILTTIFWECSLVSIVRTRPQIVVVRMFIVSTTIFVGLWIETFPTFVILFFIKDHAIKSSRHKAENDWRMIITKVNTCFITLFDDWLFTKRLAQPPPNQLFYNNDDTLKLKKTIFLRIFHNGKKVCMKSWEQLNINDRRL